MRINEVAGVTSDSGRLVALTSFLTGRAEDTSAPTKISINAFLKMAQNMGMAIDERQLRDLATQPPLNQVITNIDTNDVFFGGENVENSTMTVQQAEKTVGTMAKRAAGV